MSRPLDFLGDLPVSTFLSEFWQKRPLLIRGLFKPWICPLTERDLLNLATREDADARLILTGDEPPELYHGPFEADELEGLPDEEWTVLVQEVDRLLPSVADLLGRFRFLPNWRLDDVMVSYAVPGGGVGAHTDQYDVFLIQGSGRRRWEIESAPRPAPRWREDSDVAILAEFNPDEAWELEPGDVLYLPPGVPHNGIALEACLTLSVGCRAPSTSDLMTGILTYAAESGDDTDRYSDPDLVAAEDPGLLAAGALSRLKERIRGALADDDTLDRWLGRYVTEPVRGHSGTPPKRWVPLTTIRSRLSSGAVLRPAVVSQVAYVDHGSGRSTLFAGGQSYSGVSTDVARLLTGADRIEGGRLLPLMEMDTTAELIVTLVNSGAYVLD